MKSDAMGVDGARDVGCGCSRPSAGARSATFPLYASPDRARLDSLILLRSHFYTHLPLALERHEMRAEAPLQKRMGKGCAQSDGWSHAAPFDRRPLRENLERILTAQLSNLGGSRL